MKIQELEWDSKFFNRRVGKLTLSQSKKYELNTIKQSLFDSDFDLIYIFSDSGIDGIEAIDKKVIYINLAPQADINDMSIIDYFGTSDILYPLAYQAGHKSRFKIDSNIENDDFERLYRLWVDNSINKSFADYIKVYVQDHKPIGLITAKRYSNKISIGLIAVDNEHRGKGIGKKLMNSIMNIASKENLSVEVATQADNIQACRFYERLGFSIQDTSYIYHFWTRNNQINNI